MDIWKEREKKQDTFVSKNHTSLTKNVQDPRVKKCKSTDQKNGS